ncbi:MAG: TIGR02453 family protein [Draconibacterium sp.]|nr:TIGR02453 family protein [Draconibacterium sp.]
MDKVLQFLQELSENNNREWFNDNRKRYHENRDKIIFLTDILINEIKKFDPEITGTSPKDCMFRIFRDVRFSKNKEPYKTNFGSFIAKGGRKSIYPGYYLHIEPKESFAGGGIFMPQAPQLKTIRTYMAEHAPDFREIINEDSFKNTFHEMYDHQLKIAPKGFPKDHEFIDLLRYKSFAFTSRIQNKIIEGDNFIEHTVHTFRELHKANIFLYDALEK